MTSIEELASKVPKIKNRLEEIEKWKAFFKEFEDKKDYKSINVFKIFSKPRYLFRTYDGKKYHGTYSGMNFGCYGNPENLEDLLVDDEITINVKCWFKTIKLHPSQIKEILEVEGLFFQKYSTVYYDTTPRYKKSI